MSALAPSLCLPRATLARRNPRGQPETLQKGLWFRLHVVSILHQGAWMLDLA